MFPEPAPTSPRLAKIDMTTTIGSWAWCEQTKGRLAWTDKLRLVGNAVTSMVRLSPNMARSRLFGWHRARSPLDLAALHAPTGDAARSAFESCRQLSPPFMVHHCERTYWFSRLLGIRWGLAFDDEALYVSAMLHDIAIMDRFAGREADDHCFTIPSARLARSIAASAGWSDTRQSKVMEAITLNPNPHVPPKDGVEAHLLNAGVMVDAAGLRMWELHPEDVRTVVTNAPREHFKTDIVRYIHREADAHPGCRFHFSRRWFQLHRLAALAPFAE